MEDRYITIKVWKETRDAIRLLSALSGKSMVEVVDTVVRERLGKGVKIKDQTKGRQHGL